MERSMPWKIVSLTVLAAAMQACGGGGGGGDNPAAQTLGSGAGKSLEQLNQDYKALREAAYKGATTPAPLSADNIVPFARAIMSDEFPQAVSTVKARKAGLTHANKLPIEALFSRQQSSASFAAKTSRKRVEETQPCDNTDGSARVSGDDSADSGAVDILYKNCAKDGIIIDGPAVAYYMQGDTYPSVFFYNATRVTLGDQSIVMTGSIGNSAGNGPVTNMLWQNPANGYQYQEINYQENSSSGGNYESSNFSGTILLPEYGAVKAAGYYTIYATTELGEGSFSLTSGNLTAQVTLTSNTHEATIKLSDANDAGATKQAFTDIGNLLHSDRESRLNFVPWVDPKNPPYYSYVYFTNLPYTALTPISAAVEGVSDPDGDVVTQTYHWSINDVPVTDVQGDTLPAGRAHSGDNVTVYVELSDGINKVNTFLTQTYIDDAGGSLSAPDMPSELKVGDSLAVKVAYSDPDQPDTNFPIKLAYGPQGATLDSSGVLHWTASNLLFGKTQDFHFGFSSSESNVPLGEVTLRIVDENGSAPLVRSTFAVPYVNNAIEAIKMEGDGTDSSILVTGQDSLIYTVKKSGAAYAQDWVYPYRVGTSGRLVQAHATDLNRDGKNEIMAVTTEGLYFIENKNSEASLRYKPGKFIKSFQVADLDRDGNDEAVLLLAENDNEYYGTILHVVDAKSGTFKYQLSLPSEAREFAVGNVDHDPALEIVIANGLVYDGVSGDNEWNKADGFGDLVAVGDIDGDGIDEIFGAHNWGTYGLYSADSHSVLWTKENFNTCSVAVTNADVDAAKELVIGDCQWGNISVYDAAKTDAQLKIQLAMIEHGSLSATAIDADNDGTYELVWSSGQTSSGRDILAVGEMDGSGTTWTSDQLDWFVGAGHIQVAPDKTRAVFLTPSTNSDYDGPKITLLSETGEIETSETLTDTFYNSTLATVADFNNDGYGEIFLMSGDNYGSNVQVLKLSDFSRLWSSGRGSISNHINVVASADMNRDGHDDIIYSNGSNLVINDLFADRLIGTINTGSSTINDVAIGNIIGDATPEIVIASSADISIWVKNGNSYTLQTSVTNNFCNRIVFGNLGMDGKAQIICASLGAYWGGGSTIFVYGTDLVQTNLFPLASGVSDLQIVKQPDGKQSLLVAASINVGYYAATNAIIGEFSTAAGGFIWSSPQLVGTIPKHSLQSYIDGDSKLRLMFGTNKAMYLTQ